MVPHNVEEMIVEWEELIDNARDPIQFAMQVKEKLNGRR